MVKYEHEIGITKGTPVEKFVAGNFEGETNEVGIYLAMSRQASREGYGELAEVFKRLAWEEAEHAARFCEMNGIIKPTLKENIEWMMGGEKMANAEKREASEKAEEAGSDLNGILQTGGAEVPARCVCADHRPWNGQLRACNHAGCTYPDTA